MKDKINKLQKKISEEIEFINCGGCIHFAYYFSKRLRELGIEHSVAFRDITQFDLTYARYTPSQHVAIYIEGIGYIDGISTVQDFKQNYYIVKVTKSISLKKLDYFRNEYEWNYLYDTEQNHKVGQLINKYIH